jgi:adenylylsulfate reductase subunit A
MYQAECHCRAVLFRQETRWPGYYFRNDFPSLDEQNWKCFVNITYKNGQWDVKKVPIISIVS